MNANRLSSGEYVNYACDCVTDTHIYAGFIVLLFFANISETKFKQ